MQLPSPAQLAVTGLLASSTVAGFQMPGDTARRAAGALAILAAPVAANPIAPLDTRYNEEMDDPRNKYLRRHNDRRQSGGDGSEDDDDEDGPSPTAAFEPFKGKGKGKTGKMWPTGPPFFKPTMIWPTGVAPTKLPGPPMPKEPAEGATMKKKGHAMPIFKSMPHKTFTRPTGPAFTPPTLPFTKPAPAGPEPTFTGTATKGMGKGKGFPHPHPFPTPVAPVAPVAPVVPGAGAGAGDEDN